MLEGGSECVELAVTGATFLACSGPLATFAGAERDCQERGGELASVSSAEQNAALVTQTVDLGTHTNLWLGGTRDDDHVWRWPNGVMFWTGLGNGTAPPDVFVNWQPGEPNNESSVTAEPEACTAMTLLDGSWKDRACSLKLSYFCALPAPAP